MCMGSRGYLLASGAQEEKRQQELERKKAQEASWTVNELSLLAKAVQKFPPGTSRRWHQIADFIGTKTQEEVCTTLNPRP